MPRGGVPSEHDDDYRPGEHCAAGDHHRFRFIVLDDDGASEIYVEISGTAMACEPDALPTPLGEVIRTRGAELRPSTDSAS
jgi:hypothetical protein